MHKSQELQDWRQNFYQRLRSASDRLCSDEPLCNTQAARCREFKRFLARHPQVLKQTRELSRYQFEVLSIASTKKQLEGDLPYFSVAEVRQAFKRNPEDMRRAEVRNYLYCSRDDDEKDMVTKAYESTVEDMATASLECHAHAQVNRSTRIVDRPSTSWQRTMNFSEMSLYCQGECCDAKNFFYIVCATGGVVPKAFGQPAWTWGADGKAVQVEVPVPDLFQTPERQNSAVETLLQGRSLLTHNTEGSLLVNPNNRPSKLVSENPVWKWAALAAVCRSFPRWPNPDSACAERCKTLIPLLANVLSNLPQLPEVQEPLKRSIAEVCLSASYFGLLPWKEMMLKTAEKYCNCPQTDHLVAQLQLRARMLRRLQAKNDTRLQESSRQWPNAYLNALFGQEIIFEAKQLLDNDAPLEEIRTHLLRYQPGESAFEQSLVIQSKTVLARAYRNMGDFANANLVYNEMLPETHTVSHNLTNDCIASHAETLCELRCPEKAISLLNEEAGFQMPAKASRLRIALAYAHLTQGLLGSSRALSLNEAFCGFTRYLDQLARHPVSDLTITMKSNRYIAFAGKAMAYHALYVEGLPTSTHLDEARNLWHDTRKAARACWPRPGFAEMICLYSLVDLSPDPKSWSTETIMWKRTADNLKGKTAVQFHFVLQGTLWLQRLRSWRQVS